MKRTKEKTSSTLLANLESFNSVLNNIEELEEEHPELYEKQLLRISESYKNLLTSDRFFAEVMLGAGRVRDRAIRRSSRKPLTMKKLKSLNNDLQDLARILKV